MASFTFILFGPHSCCSGEQLPNATLRTNSRPIICLICHGVISGLKPWESLLRPTCVFTLSTSDIILLLRQTIQTVRELNPWQLCFVSMLTFETIQRNSAMHFQIWSVHRVNKLRVKQCSHHWQWDMVSHVDIAADTESDLPEAGAWGPSLEMTNSVTTTQSQYYYSLQLNKQMARYQTIFIPSEEVQEATQGFLFLLGGCRDTNRGDNSSLCSEWDSSTTAANVALHYAFAASFLEAGRI